MYTKYGTLKHGFSNFKQVFSQRCHGLRILTIHIQPQLNHHFIAFEEVRNLWLTRYKENPSRKIRVFLCRKLNQAEDLNEELRYKKEL